MAKNPITPIPIPDLPTVKVNIQQTMSQADFLARLNDLESNVSMIKNWKDEFANPNINENIKELQDLYNKTQILYNKMQNAAEDFSAQADQMVSSINNLVNNINYLITDFNGIVMSFQTFIPDLFGAIRHTIDAVFHATTSFKALKVVMVQFQSGLFPSLKKSLS